MVSAIWFIGAGLAFTVATLGWEQRQIRRKHRAMASARVPMTEEEFLSEMAARGVSRHVGQFLRAWLLYAYRDSLKPSPDDHIYSDLHVLGDDSSALVLEYFEREGRKLPIDLDASQLNDPTLAELGCWLEGWK
jgi:hypothetical protein